VDDLHRIDFKSTSDGTSQRFSSRLKRGCGQSYYRAFGYANGLLTDKANPGLWKVTRGQP